MTGRFIAVIGPSGVGKDSVMVALAAAEPRLRVVRRTITRTADAGGEDYDAVTEVDFLTRRARGCFALDWAAYGLFYGIPATVDAALAQGEDLLVNLSRSVLTQMTARFQRWDVLALTARAEVLRARLIARGRETPEDIDRRLVRAEAALPPGVPVKALDNSGPIDQTVAAARALLYPSSEKRLIS